MRTSAKKFILLASLLVLITPSLALAQSTPVIPEFNPVCWKEKDCLNIRAQLLRKDPKDLTEQEKSGWLKNQGPDCPGEEWGKCLPAGVIDTQIAFGGRRRFLHIGDFIQTMYKYAIGVAGILATVMIIVAGFQWVLSGGNAESIQSAKKRIVGAVIGVVIAYLSYAILNTLNPALVNLRLPQTWMVRPQALVPVFCSAAPEGAKFGWSGKDAKDQITPVTNDGSVKMDLTFTGLPLRPSDDPYLNDKYKKDTFYCGNRFFIKDGGGNATCFGNVCDPKKVCVDFPYQGKSPAQKYTCFEGMLMGYMSGSDLGGSRSLIGDGDDVQLIAMCADGSIEEVETIDNTEKGTQYRFEYDSAIESKCGGPDKILGFYLGVEVNDEEGTLAGGVVAQGIGASAGNDDWFAVGQSAPGSRMCDLNLSTLVYQKIIGSAPQCSTVECSCSYLNIGKVGKAIAKDPEFIKPHLISLEDLRQGYTCNVNISRGEYPAVDGVTVKSILSKSAGGGAIGFLSGVGGWAGVLIGAVADVAQIDDPTDCFDTKISNLFQ